jgi:uncharacterized protein (DUF433 family)
MDQSRIVLDRQSGQERPVVRDTGISVRQVLSELARGLSGDAVLARFPQLTASDLRAALDYAGRTVDPGMRTVDEPGWSREQAASIRHQLIAFAEDWDDPEMDVYDAHFPR